MTARRIAALRVRVALAVACIAFTSCTDSGSGSSSSGPSDVSSATESSATAPPADASSSPVPPDSAPVDTAGGASETTTTTAATTTTAPTTTTTIAPRDVPAARSAGCDGVSSMVAGESTVPFTGNEMAGSYVVHVPASALSGTPMPLVFDLHGYSEPAAVHVIQSGLAAFGETAGFITVVPGIDRPVPRWDVTIGGPDVEFLRSLLDHLENSACIDTNRVYFAGLSNGAFMTSTVACDLSALVAAVAPVAGIQAPQDCGPDRRVPVVTFHGTDDGFVPYTGGLGERVSTLPSPDGTGTIGSVLPADDPSVDRSSVPDRTAAWAERNGCSPEPAEEPVADDVTLIRFDCPPGDEVLLYRIEGGGHSWPGSEFSKQIESIVGPTTFSISANEILWEFFLDHPLRS